MSSKAAIFEISLIILIFCITCTSFGADTDLITSGQKVTLAAPSGDYLYRWTAEADGGTLALGDQQSFTFIAPDVSQKNQTKIVTVIMLIRSINGEYVNQKTAEIPVYALPACGIGGPSSAGPEDSMTYSYEGGATGKLSYEWSVDNVPINGSNAPSVTIDWSKYSPTDHIVALKISKDYSDIVPGAQNPIRDVTCSYPVTIAYASALEISKIPSQTSASVGKTITYNYSVKNTGSIAVKGLSLTDDKLDSIILDKANLSPGDVAIGTSSHTIAETDLPGPLMNNATASGTDRAGRPLTATGNASVSLTYVSAFTIDEKASEATAKVGDTIAYTYTVSNTGNTTLSGFKLTDDKLGSIVVTPGSLKPGGTANGTANYVVTEKDLPGPIVNSLTAKATDSTGKSITSTTTASVELTYTREIKGRLNYVGGNAVRAGVDVRLQEIFEGNIYDIGSAVSSRQDGSFSITYSSDRLHNPYNPYLVIQAFRKASPFSGQVKIENLEGPESWVEIICSPH